MLPMLLVLFWSGSVWGAAACAPEPAAAEARLVSSPLHLLSAELTVPPFKPVFRSINITDPCYTDPTADACKTFARAHGGGWAVLTGW